MPYQRVSRAIRETRARLSSAKIESADAEARALVSFAAQAERSLVLIDALPADFGNVLEQAVSRRLAREPLQLIVGRTVFRRVVLETAQGVFIPRPETEVAIDVVHEWRQSYETQAATLRALDCCTGSGTLAASLLDEFPDLCVSAFDLNEKAVELARRNLASAACGAVERFVVEHKALPLEAGEAARFGASLLGPSGRPFDLIVANPPYIPAEAIPKDPEVLNFDPAESLFGGGEDGLDTPRAVLALAAEVIADAGLVLMEHADVQGAATRALAAHTDRFDRIWTVRDLTGRDRFLAATAKRRDHCASIPRGHAEKVRGLHA